MQKCYRAFVAEQVDMYDTRCANLPEHGANFSWQLSKFCLLYIKLLYVFFWIILERFSIQCRKTKTKVITTTNRKNVNNIKDQTEFEANTCNRCQARENACERGTIGFASHWLRKRREFW